MSHVWCLAITSQLLIEINSVASTHTILHLSNTQQHHRHIIILLNSIINSIFRLKRGSHRNSVLIWRHMQPDWPHWWQHLSRCTIKLADDISIPSLVGLYFFICLLLISEFVSFFILSHHWYCLNINFLWQCFLHNHHHTCDTHSSLILFRFQVIERMFHSFIHYNSLKYL